MKRNSLITLVALSLLLLVSAFSRTRQNQIDFELPPSVQAATDASLKSNAAAFPATQKLKLPKISISLTFGRAKKNCGGWGICKITLGKISAARTVPAELSRTEDGKLELKLLERAAEEEATLFVDEDVPLSADIAKKLGVKNATIQRGEYAFSASKSRLNTRLTK